MPLLELPQPMSPRKEDEKRDWADSALYKFVLLQTQKNLINKGLAIGQMAEVPLTERDLSDKERAERNLK